MKSQGILYIYYGNKLEDELEQSIRSIQKTGLDYKVVRLEENYKGLGVKSEMYKHSPFDETLFLDTDTVVLSENLEYGFEMAQKFGLAITLAPACFAARFSDEIRNDMNEYNTGVIFFKKDPDVEMLFSKWNSFSHLYDNDQPSFARAVYETNFNPFILPQNWNFRNIDMNNIFFGPLKIWHSRDKVPQNIKKWNKRDDFIFGTVSFTNKVKPLFPFWLKILRILKDKFFSK